MVAHASELKGKLKERVEQYGDQALLSKKLATIKIDVPVSYDEHLLEYKGPNKEALTPIFEEMEFKTMMARAFAGIGGAAVVPTVSQAASSQGSQLSMFGASQASSEEVAEKRPVSGKRSSISKSEKSGLLEKWKNSKEIALEVLTDDAEHFDFTVTGIAFSASAGESHYGDAAQLQDFAPLLADERILKVGHNIKASMLALKKKGIAIKGPVFDTMLAHYLIEPEASHDLGIIANQYLGVQLSEGKEERELAMERVDVALQLRPKLQRELEERRHSLLARI